MMYKLLSDGRKDAQSKGQCIKTETSKETVTHNIHRVTQRGE